MKNKCDIIWLDSVDSTNNEAKRRILTCDNMTVLSAESQSSGRGQRGNTWSSRPGENLTFSIILKEVQHISATSQFVLSEITALSVVDFLSSHGIKAMIKWPNDIYVADKKICGILIENSLHGNRLSTSIIGIGLNINQRNFDVMLVNPTSMSLESPSDTTFDTRDCLERFLQIFLNNLNGFSGSEEDFSNLRQRYLARLWRRNERHSYMDLREGKEFKGIIRNLSRSGLLVVENEKGESKEFAFKEISYIL